MKGVIIFLNKYTRSTLLVFFLMGITYLFLGASSLINNELLTGVIQVTLALVALIFLGLSVLPSNSFKLYYSIDEEKISIRNSFIFKEKSYYWEEIEYIEKTKTEIIIGMKQSKGKIRLTALNYNELQLFMTNFKSFVDKFKINYISN